MNREVMLVHPLSRWRGPSVDSSGTPWILGDNQIGQIAEKV